MGQSSKLHAHIHTHSAVDLVFCLSIWTRDPAALFGTGTRLLGWCTNEPHINIKLNKQC